MKIIAAVIVASLSATAPVSAQAPTDAELKTALDICMTKGFHVARSTMSQQDWDSCLKVEREVARRNDEKLMPRRNSDTKMLDDVARRLRN
jgi:hypothetical protein